MMKTTICNVTLPTLTECGSICNFNLNDLQNKMYNFGYKYGYKDSLDDNKNDTVSSWNQILLPVIVASSAGLVAGFILREVYEKLQPTKYFTFFSSEAKVNEDTKHPVKN